MAESLELSFGELDASLQLDDLFTGLSERTLQRDGQRCNDVIACWAMLLIGTGRIASLREASSIALASVRSVLLPSR